MRIDLSTLCLVLLFFSLDCNFALCVCCLIRVGFQLSFGVSFVVIIIPLERMLSACCFCFCRVFHFLFLIGIGLHMNFVLHAYALLCLIGYICIERGIGYYAAIISREIFSASLTIKSITPIATILNTR
jgi:hypothetical protein